MPIIDPYETSYGKVINKSRLIKEVQDYIIRSDERLSYEYIVSEDTGFAIITGWNKEEQDLPVFDHPLIIQDVKKRNIVVVDVRKFVKNHDVQPSAVNEIVKDGAGYEFTVLRGLLTVDFLNHEYGNLRQIYNGISMSYAAVVATLLHGCMNFNPQELVRVEIACAYFANLLFIDQRDIPDMRNNIVARVSNFKYSIPVGKSLITSTLEDIPEINQDIYGLITLIKTVIPEEKAELVNDALLVNLLSNIWYGPGGNEPLVIGLEHMPTWIAIVYVSLANLMYKRAKLTSILTKYNKSIDSKEYIKEIEIYLKEHK